MNLRHPHDRKGVTQLKKVFAKSLVAALLPAILLTGCALEKNSGSGFGNEGTKSFVSGDDKVSFDWYINYSWFNTKWGDNAVSKAITDKTGVYDFVDYVRN